MIDLQSRVAHRRRQSSREARCLSMPARGTITEPSLVQPQSRPVWRHERAGRVRIPRCRSFYRLKANRVARPQRANSKHATRGMGRGLPCAQVEASGRETGRPHGRPTVQFGGVRSGLWATVPIGGVSGRFEGGPCRLRRRQVCVLAACQGIGPAAPNLDLSAGGAGVPLSRRRLGRACRRPQRRTTGNRVEARAAQRPSAGSARPNLRRRSWDSGPMSTTVIRDKTDDRGACRFSFVYLRRSNWPSSRIRRWTVGRLAAHPAGRWQRSAIGRLLAAMTCGLRPGRPTVTGRLRCSRRHRAASCLTWAAERG
jgi:hypothetical protein